MQPLLREGYVAGLDMREQRKAHTFAQTLSDKRMAEDRKQEEAEVKKICPTCGTTYDAGTTFCGKDGSTLTTLN